ncbi:MAG TPA: NUDIX domain-containing protein [Lacibacter sp.]|nr:NUDIX domain-containing protein [Lacibacter sp.]HMO90115.1 NUDIX domain-containing protein [Lacibacter sp.]HMP85728.1 NUDIX domain-containing protein [Lacibacter sp.]
MEKNEALLKIIDEGGDWFMPSLSVDCVVFGFHDNVLKVLLLKHRHLNLWSLPGGFIYKEEAVDAAAQRVLRERTGLNELFLRQFHVFGEPNRYDQEFHRRDLKKDGIEVPDNHWILQRYATLGYYALVEYSKVTPSPDSLTESCMWWEIHKTPALILDHRQIIDKALETLRIHLGYLPVGYNLLPEKFTMPELQKLYETILDKRLDRRNFQRKLLGFKILKRLPETREGVAHKAPFLYSFDKVAYHEALLEGLGGKW